MSEVTRYILERYPGIEFVRYDDYKALAKRVEEKNDQWQMCCRDRDALAKRVEELEAMGTQVSGHRPGRHGPSESARLSALVTDQQAENKRLREAIGIAVEICRQTLSVYSVERWLTQTLEVSE